MPASARQPPHNESLGPNDIGQMTSVDGTTLYTEWFETRANQRRGLALIAHGYAEHIGRYHEVARVLTGAGFSTLGFDFRGHGKSDGKRGHTRRFRDYLDDTETALRELDRRADDRELPVLLLGHSNGGLIALRLLSDPTRAPHRIKGAVITSPFLGLKAKLPAWKKRVGVLAGRYAPALSMRNDLQIENLTHDADKLAARRADTLCNDVATARWFTAAQRAHQYVLDHVVRLAVPTLWLVAGGDRIADPTATRAVHARVRAPSSYREYPQMHHEVLNEVDRNDCFDEIRSFAEQYF